MLSPSVKGTPGRFTPGRSRLGPPQRVNENGNGHRVRVVARVRPFLEAEVSSLGGKSNCTLISKGAQEDSLTIKNENASSLFERGGSSRKPACTLRISCHVKAKVCRCEEYKLDACYGEATDNAEVFANEIQPILQCLSEGQNATVFAYGATGSGKTHTMQGNENDPGLMSRAVSGIFDAAASHGHTVAISYYEVYMDRCYDLLEMKREVPILEDHNGNIQFRGLAKVEISDVEEFQCLLAEGCARRRVGSTVLNDVSSRSHGVLAVTVTSTDVTTGVRREGKLNLIDLAGNEDNRKSGTDGVRLAESSHINQSLFALSNVINALNANDARVPYRDSKLTRILRDSLGGTSRSVMVACLNPGSYSEAARTLSLAARSRQVVNHTEGGRPMDDLSKLDMVAKLQAWKESKIKTPVKPLSVPCSPSPLKSFLLRSPPQIRSPKTPASNKNFLERISNKTRVKNTPKVNLPPAVPPKKSDPASPAKDENNRSGIDINGERESEALRSPSTFSESLYNNCNNPLFQHGDSPSDNYDDESEKENDFLQLIGCPYTPLNRKSNSQLVQASPPLSVKLKTLARALHPSALSPVDANIDTNVDAPVCQKPPHELIRDLDSSFCTPTFSDAETPFERFSRSTAKLREVLVEQFLDMLNTAPRDQLLMLKGFGERRTDAIFELRECSPEPMKDIKDLEKIGLSAKQAYAIFNSNVVRQVSFAL